MAAEGMSEVMDGVQGQTSLLEFLSGITFLLTGIGLERRKLSARDLAVDSTDGLHQLDHALDLLAIDRRVVDLQLLNVLCGSIAHSLFAKLWIEYAKE